MQRIANLDIVVYEGSGGGIFQSLGWVEERNPALRSMRTYKSTRIQSGAHFFTVPLGQRHGNDLLVRYIYALRAAFTRTTGQHRSMLSISNSIDGRWIGIVLSAAYHCGQCDPIALRYPFECFLSREKAKGGHHSRQQQA